MSEIDERRSAGVSRGEELSDVLARRADSNPDKIKIHDVHGGTS
jgi:hypothetical protein